MNFQIGDRVRWQARTGDPEREGTINHVIPAGAKPLFEIPAIFHNRFPALICFDVEGERSHESYIILTDPGKRGGKPSAFRPLVKNLKLVKPENKQQ